MGARTWFVIAAAGRASRYGGTVPKPYLRIAGRTLIEHAARALMAVPGVAGGVVVLATGDRRWERLPPAVRRRLVAVEGGPTRAASVLNGLQALVVADAHDFVLVHDAARPAVPRADIAALVAACRRERVGGLLAAPVADTLKRSDGAGRSAGTLAREGLWRALTPQMFRLGLLRGALEKARDEGYEPTDEAEALERAGHAPRLVEGSGLNVKVTRPDDLALAAAALSAGRRRR
ncbi:MAG TPA: 2-C-methyl-D-erythritol 4-phosphate cytidylyltransferase [Steroidobacteraceae bacterium]|nr:2-C-methyl-D-erythritol 4-phosphate cytidylyltransferase [Steroidobacteraceae bacterium]